MNYGLPKTLTVNGREEPIRWEYTAVLDVMSAMNDPNLDDKEKAYSCMYIIYENFEDFSKEDYKSAFEAMLRFINNGDMDDEGPKRNVKTVDFEQDYNLLIPAINRVAGKEIRACDDIHWWTFLSWFMEIGECTYSTVLSIRTKKRDGKKLEKWEQEFYTSNRKLVDIKVKLTDEEKAREAWLNSLLD